MYPTRCAWLLPVIAAFFLSGCGSGSMGSYTGVSSYGGIFSGSQSSGSDSYKYQSTSKRKAVHRATLRPYSVFGVKYYPRKVEVGETMTGVASWYGPNFHGNKTSSGETYDMYDLTAAHKTWPMHTKVKVDNLENGRSIIVRINDRGPFVKQRILDLSYLAGRKLGVHKKGTARVRLTVVGVDDAHWPKGQGGSAPRIVKKAEPKRALEQIRPLKRDDARESKKTEQPLLVQVGSFSTLERARLFQQEKLAIPLKYASKIEEQNGLFKVMVGGFKSEAEAREFIQKGRHDGAFLVKQ